MKAIYIKPTTEVVALHTKADIAYSWKDLAGSVLPYHTANQGDFFAEEDHDEDYDPFFDE